VNARRGAVQYRSVSPVNLLNELYEEKQKIGRERLDSKEPGGLGFGPALDPRCPRHLGLAMSEIGYGGESRPCILYDEGPKSIDISSASAHDLPSPLSLHVLRAIDEIPERPPLNS